MPHAWHWPVGELPRNLCREAHIGPKSLLSSNWSLCRLKMNRTSVPHYMRLESTVNYICIAPLHSWDLGSSSDGKCIELAAEGPQ
jgi:hypothetical protein